MSFMGRFRAFEGWYLPLVLCLWALAPGLRRIVDWQFGRNPFSLLSVLPMLSLLPLAIIVYRNASAPGLRLPFKALSYLWLFGFGYALVVALASGGRVSALYDFAQFCVPMLMGLWIVLRPSSRTETFRQLSSTLLGLAAFESVYGLYQFIAPPPWDVTYVNDLQQGSLGMPEPFGLHPFAMLNSHATLSIFLFVAILLNLHKLDLRRPGPLLVAILSIVIMGLTTVRSSWLALAVGIIVYIFLSPKRGQAVFALGAVGIIAVVLISNASILLGNSDVTDQLQTRVNTLGDVGQDASVEDRREQTLYALRQGLAEPLGQGLGTVGTSTWLGGSQDDSKVSTLILDDGYVARLLEMGIPGIVCYLAALATGAILGFRALTIALATNNVVYQQIAVAGLAVQAAFMGLDLSGDSHSLLGGLFFWIVLGLSLRYEPGDELVDPAWNKAQPVTPTAKRPLWA